MKRPALEPLGNGQEWLRRFDPSPVVELNRAMAVAEAEGPQRGLALVESIGGLDGYQPWHVARAELLARCGRMPEAGESFRSAMTLTDNPVQRAHLEGRLAALSGG